MDSFDLTAMRLALAEAETALLEGEVPVGAALYRGETLLWSDHNRREARKDPTAHAEMLCLRHGAEQLGDWRLKDCTLYVTLEPCPMCAGAIVNAHIPRVVFGASDPAGRLLCRGISRQRDGRNRGYLSGRHGLRLPVSRRIGPAGAGE